MKQKRLTFSTLLKQIDSLMLCDKQCFIRRLHNTKKIKDPNIQQTVYQKIAQEIEQATQKVILREASRPVITYPENLPINHEKQNIFMAVRDYQVVIVSGETGSGKTTQLPKICMELGRGIKGLIGHTQPRRLAARTVMYRISEELQIKPGSCIGYKVRFSDYVDNEKTLVKLMTDGMLLAEIQQDRMLMQYDTIIIDEAHERNLNIDFLLGYLKALLPYRPDLKVVVTSATIDLDRFSRHFNNAPIIEVPGRTYPVEVRYRPIIKKSNKEANNIEYHYQIKAIFDILEELNNENSGDILIFMSGESEIRNTVDMLRNRKLRYTEILPLYARLSNSEQDRVFQFQSNNVRRIVVTTNIAETSLTVPGIKYVIDFGTARISRYDHRKKIQRLSLEPISQASANQRKGRCGRTSEGICIRLYSKDDFLSRPEFTDPEILRTNLASVILKMTAIGINDITEFPFIEAPNKRNIQDGIRLLKELGAITVDKQNTTYKLTSLGQKLSQLPVDPRLARMILEAKKYGCVHEVMIIVSALSIQDPRERPIDKQQIADEKHHRFHNKESDFMIFIYLWNYLGDQKKVLSSDQFRRQCRVDFLNYLRVCEWQDIYAQLHHSMQELNFSLNSKPAEYREIHISLLTGLLSLIGMKVPDKKEYVGTRNVRFSIFPGSGLLKKLPKWVMVAELIETSRLWGYIAARIDPEWIELVAQPFLLKRSYSDLCWEREQGAVIATERVSVYGLPVVTARKVRYSQIDPVLCRELFIRHALVEGDWQTHHSFFHKNLKLRSEVKELEHKSRRCDILVDDEVLFKFYDQRISFDITSAYQFNNWWRKVSRETPDLLTLEKSMLIKNNARLVSNIDYPNFWYHGNLKLPLTYQFEPGTKEDGVTVHIPLLLLNQIEENGFEWQVPGMRRELVVALIKSLPKLVRRNLTPIQDYAEAFLKHVIPLDLPLLDALECELGRMTGVIINRQSWRLDQVPNHLKIIFRVVDDKNRKLYESRSLNTLKEVLKEKVKEVLSDTLDNNIEQNKLYFWNFGNLAKIYEKQHGDYKVKAWPALVDERDSVAIKLFDNPQDQQRAMRHGLRRLLLLNSPSLIGYLYEKLPNRIKIGLYFSLYSRVLDLIDDCISCGVDKLIDESGGLVWTEEGFMKLHEKIHAELIDTVEDIVRRVEKILSTVFNIKKRLKNRIDINMVLGLSDIKAQINGLVYRGFVTNSGFKRLDDILRYLQAIEKRLEKLTVNPRQDLEQMLKIKNVQQVWKKCLSKLSPSRHNDKDVQAIRWMIEELRVSFFAQQLHTPYPISDKRILKAMMKITT